MTEWFAGMMMMMISMGVDAAIDWVSVISLCVGCEDGKDQSICVPHAYYSADLYSLDLTQVDVGGKIK